MMCFAALTLLALAAPPAAPAAEALVGEAQPTAPEATSSDEASDPAAAPPSDATNCADTFDQTARCKPPQKTLFIPRGEPISQPTYNEFPVEVEQDTLALQFVAVSAVPAAVALSLHLVSLFYTLHALRLDDAGTLRPDERDRVDGVQSALLYGAIGAWFTTAMVSGTGLALWIFNPKDGDVRPVLKAD